MHKEQFDELINLWYIKYWEFILKNWEKSHYLTWYNWVENIEKVNDILWEIFLQKYKKLLWEKIHFIALANSWVSIAKKLFSISQKYNKENIISITNPKNFDIKDINNFDCDYKVYLVDNSVISWKTLIQINNHLKEIKIDWCFYIYCRNQWDEPTMNYPLYEIFSYEDIKPFL